jgi:hypothetical protein
MNDEGITCPACGGSGGGPFGRPGSAWDVEGYVCPRCKGAGMLQVTGAETARAARPLAKGSTRRPEVVTEKRGPVRARPATASSPTKESSAGSGRRRTK